MASPRQESTKNNRPSKEHLDHPTALGRRTAVYQKDSLLFGKQLIGSGDVVPCMAERSRERKTHSKRLGNTSNARDTDKEGKAESACCRGQRFTAGILISPQTDQLNTKEAATTQIWCDICHAGFGVQPIFVHCCPGSAMFQEVKSGQPGVEAPTHAECDAEQLIKRSQWKCAGWQEGMG